MLESLRVGSYIVDRVSKTLLLEGQRVPITKRQFETLQVLLSANGETVDREAFLEKVWADTIVEDSNLTQTIFMLRRILGRLPDGEDYIETVAKRGYCLSKGAVLATERVFPMPSSPSPKRKEFIEYGFQNVSSTGWRQ